MQAQRLRSPRAKAEPVKIRYRQSEVSCGSSRAALYSLDGRRSPQTEIPSAPPRIGAPEVRFRRYFYEVIDMSELFQSIRENLSFLLVCLLVSAALAGIAALAERFRGERRRLSAAHTISFVAIFSAIAGVLMLLEIPLFFAPSFYKMDLSEIPVMICAFYLGPVSGVICEFIKVLLKLLLKGTTTNFVGDFANFAVGCSFVLPASILYHWHRSRKGAIAALLTGTAVMTVFGSMFNALYLIPKFAQLFGMPLDAIVAMGTQVNSHITSVGTLALFAVVPFNLLKGLIVSLLTYLLYKRVERLFFRRGSTQNC